MCTQEFRETHCRLSCLLHPLTKACLSRPFIFWHLSLQPFVYLSIHSCFHPHIQVFVYPSMHRVTFFRLSMCGSELIINPCQHPIHVSVYSHQASHSSPSISLTRLLVRSIWVHMWSYKHSAYNSLRQEDQHGQIDLLILSSTPCSLQQGKIRTGRSWKSLLFSKSLFFFPLSVVVAILFFITAFLLRDSKVRKQIVPGQSSHYTDRSLLSTTIIYNLEYVSHS